MSVCRGTAPPRAAAAPGKGRMRACACAFIVHEKEGVRVLQMAKSDKTRCPKGGWSDYRSGPWYKLIFGAEQGTFLTATHEKAYGHGAYADKPYRYSRQVYVIE